MLNDPANDSVEIYLPKEYLDDINEIIRAGLREADISREARRNLTGWWDAEFALIKEEK